MAIERLRLVTSADAVESARDIFQTYITPSAEKIVKLDTRLVRGMEAYLYGMKFLSLHSWQFFRSTVYNFLQIKVLEDTEKYKCHLFWKMDNKDKALEKPDYSSKFLYSVRH